MLRAEAQEKEKEKDVDAQERVPKGSRREGAQEKEEKEEKEEAEAQETARNDSRRGVSGRSRDAYMHKRFAYFAGQEVRP